MAPIYIFTLKPFSHKQIELNLMQSGIDLIRDTARTDQSKG